MSSEQQYFKDDDLALDVWLAKYRHKGESLNEFFDRVIKEFSRLDPFSLEIPLPEEKFAALSPYGQALLFNKDRLSILKELFYNFAGIVPGGSVYAGIGSDKPVSLSNCYVIKTGDSIEQIFNAAREMAEIYKRRGGVGEDLSDIRPAGALVNNAAETTGGVVPFMDLYSTTTTTIGQDGRRGALMLSLDINHPDSPQFIISKQDLSKVTGANISVRLNDEFMKAVENDSDYILRWPVHLNPRFLLEKIEELPYNELIEVNNDLSTSRGYIKKIKAKELWDSIIYCAWNTAEPGILFWDNIIEQDPASVYEDFRAVSTNPCGEIPLSPYDSCRLIANNLYYIVDNPFTSKAVVNQEKAYKLFYMSQIIGDTLVDLEIEAIDRIISVITEPGELLLWKKIRNIGAQGRRTGVGITALGDMLAALGAPYTDLEIIDYVMKLKMSAELDASIDLAIMHNSFPAYNEALEYYNNEDNGEYIGGNKFYQFLKEEFPEQYQRMFIDGWGRRNISWSTIAPTGSISILAGTSAGCEPTFSLYYTRKKKCNAGEIPDSIDQNGIGFKHYNVVHGKFKEWYTITRGDDADKLKDLNPEVLDLLIKQSPWYGSLAEDLSPGNRVAVQSTLQRYTTHSISSTVNVAKDTPKEDIATIYIEAYKQQCKGITVYRDGSRTGILVKTESVTKPEDKRPDELECRVEQFKNEKKDWVAFVGILNGKPYEIFTGPKDLDTFPIPSSVTKGFIIKVRQDDGTSRYDFRYIDSYGYTNTLGGLSRIFDKEYWNYARFVSAFLRENTPLEKIIKIVEGLSFTNKGMNSWKAGIIRTIKVFIENGTEVIGAVCENCGGNHIIYQETCMVCKDCGSSKCG